MKTFDARWEAFIREAGERGKLFTSTDRSLSFAFYTYGALDTLDRTLERLEREPSELAELGV